MSTQAARLVFRHLRQSLKTGRPQHRAAVHDAAAIVGMAMANTLFGATHAIGLALQGAFSQRAGKKIHQGVFNSILTTKVRDLEW